MSIQEDTKNFLCAHKLRAQEFAGLVGINPVAFSKFMNREGKSIAERIAPYIYGRKPLPTASPTTAPEEPAGKGFSDAY